MQAHCLHAGRVTGPPKDGTCLVADKRPPCELMQGHGSMLVARVMEDRPLVNSCTYAQRAPNERWSPDETDLFYRVCSPSCMHSLSPPSESLCMRKLQQRRSLQLQPFECR